MTLSIIGFGLAAVLAVTSIVFFVLWRTKKPAEAVTRRVFSEVSVEEAFKKSGIKQDTDYLQAFALGYKAALE